MKSNCLLIQLLIDRKELIEKRSNSASDAMETKSIISKVSITINQTPAILNFLRQEVYADKVDQTNDSDFWSEKL